MCSFTAGDLLGAHPAVRPLLGRPLLLRNVTVSNGYYTPATSHPVGGHSPGPAMRCQLDSGAGARGEHVQTHGHT